MYATFVVITDEVTEAERDESCGCSAYVRLPPGRTGEATRWLQPWRRDTKRKQPEIEDLLACDEVFQKLVEAMPVQKRLARLALEQVLRTFVPERRLTGLTPPSWILALPVKVLRVLPEEYLRSLRAELQDQVRKPLQGAAYRVPRHLGPSTEVLPLTPVFCLHPTLTAPTFGFE